MIERTLMALAAAAAIVAAAAVSVISAAFALFALLRPEVGPAGAAAIVAAVFATIVGLAGIFDALRSGAASRERQRQPDPLDIADRVIGIAKERPFVAAGAALAAGILLVRNPGLVGAIARAFVEGRPNRRP